MVFIKFSKKSWTIVMVFIKFSQKPWTIVIEFLKKSWTIVHGFHQIFEKIMDYSP